MKADAPGCEWRKGFPFTYIARKEGVWGCCDGCGVFGALEKDFFEKIKKSIAFLLEI
ncbi:hypothetical protein [Angelakisella massiliensis]|uniref:hypothetical protein n=1 Tax=Angelakisella massiliensis TaxID=1871018 RepID=UPI00155DE932|nr:hypothetical protein [Angelakisella massiliensis]